MEVTGVDVQKTCTRVKYLLCRALCQSPYGAQRGACPGPHQGAPGPAGHSVQRQGVQLSVAGEAGAWKASWAGGWSEKGAQ